MPEPFVAHACLYLSEHRFRLYRTARTSHQAIGGSQEVESLPFQSVQVVVDVYYPVAFGFVTATEERAAGAVSSLINVCV